MQRSSLTTARIYFIAASLLFVYVLVRAVKVDFTHDESLSWQILQGDEIQRITANNHWLNTALMYLFSRIGGDSEIILRLPNVLAFALYVFFVYRIYNAFSNSRLALLLAFPVLFLNPFVLDFFGLARGYGLALAFFTGALYYSLEFVVRTRRFRQLALAALMSSLCIYANFAFLIAVFSLNLSVFLLMARRRQSLRTMILCFSAEILSLLPALFCILRLKQTNALYYGGNSGVLSDTIVTLAEKSFSGFPVLAVPVIAIATTAVLLLFFVKKPAIGMLKLLVPALVIVPTGCFYALDMSYALDRAGIFWAVITGMVVLLSVEKAGETAAKKNFQLVTNGVSAVLAVCFLVNFAVSANVSSVILWKHDAANEQALKAIVRSNPRKERVSLGATWLMEPSLNYYRQTLSLDWLEPITRDSVYKDFDYYYVERSEVARVGAKCTRQLADYSVPGTLLLKNCGKEPSKIGR